VHLVVEVDGDVHDLKERADAVRERYLRHAGYRVLRFTNQEVFHQLPGVLETVMGAIEDVLAATHSPSRGSDNSVGS
jgi:very-short-patch-repair endonuclease